MRFPRASGILLHPTSLPGSFGIGDLGPAAIEFLEFLSAARQTYWQVLPLGPTGYGDSPYQCFSAFAGSTLLISFERLVEHGLLARELMEEHPPFAEGRADYGGVYEWKSQLLPLAYQNFRRSADKETAAQFDAFVCDHADWLDDYALYRAIKAEQGHRPWFEWDAPLKLREPGAMSAIAGHLEEKVEAEKFAQFLFFSQWAALKGHAARLGIKVVGDIPIFVALDSADVWCRRDLFKLNPDGSPKVVAGVPPDYFSKTGQLWGNPIYDWDAMKGDGFRWWADRVRHTLTMVDVARIDHFRGFSAVWEVPGGDKTAENGSWVDVPGEELFTALENEVAELPLWAEDLGVMTAEVESLRDSFELPGMRILQYAFGGDARNRDLPHNYVPNCVVYTGTHDNDTVLGWWQSMGGNASAGEEGKRSPQQNFCLEYLNADGSEINWDLLRAAWSSVADTAIVPMQDLLGLGSEARMNLPASDSGNWQWRISEGDAGPELAARLRKLTELYARDAAPATLEPPVDDPA